MARRARRTDDGAAGRGGDGAAGWATLVVGLIVTGFLFWRNRQTMGFEEYYLLNTGLLLWIPLVVILLCLRRETADFGMTGGDLRGGLLTALVLFLLFVPVILFVAPMEPFQEYYLRMLVSSRALTGTGWSGQALTGGQIDYARLAFHTGVFGFYMFAWEWYFRGFLLFGLKRLMPSLWAALIQAAFFALLHYGKPPIEVASSFFGALLLAVVALRFRSFLPCFALHWAVSAAFDAAVLYFHFHPGVRLLPGL